MTGEGLNTRIRIYGAHRFSSGERTAGQCIFERGTTVQGWCLIMPYPQMACVPHLAWFVRLCAVFGPASCKINVKTTLMVPCTLVYMHAAACYPPRSGVGPQYNEAVFWQFLAFDALQYEPIRLGSQI